PPRLRIAARPGPLVKERIAMRLRLVVFALLAGAATATLNAQTFRGGIQGAVSDETGAALPGATVTATNTGTGLSRSVQTDSSGNYFFSELPLGEYNVT